MTFEDLLQQYNIPIAPSDHQHSRGGWIQIDCPNCDSAGHFRLGYNITGKYTNCWHCGFISLHKVIGRLTKLPWTEIQGIIKDLPSEQIPDDVKRGTLKFPICKDLLPIHKRYLRFDRGLDLDTVVPLWGLKGTGLAARLAYRIVIPITLRGKIVSWTTRGLTNDNPRYISAAPEEEEINHKTLLFGEDYARHTIIICEGPFDVFAIGPGAVATLGIAYSRAQLLAMTRYLRRIVCFDADFKAQQRARNLCDELMCFPGETWNIHLDSKDPGEATQREIQKIRRHFLGDY